MARNLSIRCDHRNNLILDASLMKKITSPGIQLLVSLFKSMTNYNKQLLVENYLPEIEEVIRDFGLLDMIAKWGRAL